MDFVIPPAKPGEALGRAIYAALREGILAGRIPAGSRLPSTRTLADQRGVSRSTVVLAYEQLLAEGFLRGRHGSGTYVAPALSRPPEHRRTAPLPLATFGRAAAAHAVRRSPRESRVLPFDFATGSELASFPFALWNRILLRCARRSLVADLDYADPAGSERLREAICLHLRRSRGVRADASRIIIVNGSQQALDLVARVLIDRGQRVAVEDPSYPGTTQVLRAAGARLAHVPVDDQGIDPSLLPPDARCVFVTPSHQFPTGATLSLERRLALLHWARRHNAVVIEDDYDGEFRYDAQPLESLQGLDEDSRVVYVGTFSRTIFPALRIGYLVAPTSLVPALTSAKWLSDRHTAQLEQKALAEFIESGAYGVHLRRVGRRNASRRAQLLAALQQHLAGKIDITGDAAGTHLVVWPRQVCREQELIERARARGIGIYGVAPYCHRPPARPGFMLGYARLQEEQIREGIRRLGRIM